MQVEVTNLTRRGAAVMRRSHTVSAESIRFGRGSDNEVQLADLRVELSAAVLHAHDGGLFIEQLGDAPLRVAGQPAATAVLHAGSEILIGPYKIVLGEPPEGCDAALSIELVQPVGDALQRLSAESRIGLQQARLSKRGTAWVLFVGLAILCLAVPIWVYTANRTTGAPVSAKMAGTAGREAAGAMAGLGASPPGAPGAVVSAINLSWNPGELSNAHRFFAADCGTCHLKAFALVPDRACLSCHIRVGAHFAAGAPGIALFRHGLAQTRCASCHQEHRGRQSLVVSNASLCVDCHRDLAQKAPEAGIRDVDSFPAGHPQFRATVVADAAKARFIRVELGARLPVVDHPNLHFSHAAHLVPAGFPVLGYKPLGCDNCHKPDATGQSFVPITYKADCQSCHALTFDAELPWKTVPHGDDKGVRTGIADFYAAIALKGGVPEPAAPALVRRAPGTPVPEMTPGERRQVLDWVAQKTDAAIAIVFDSRRGCGYCHVVDEGASGPIHAAKPNAAHAASGATEAGMFGIVPEEAGIRVEPVLMRTRFLPGARFDHAAHRAVACESCHLARQSDSSSELLIPGIKTCVACHGSPAAPLKAQSTCTSCHVFHQQEFGPMRETVAAEK